MKVWYVYSIVLYLTCSMAVKKLSLCCQIQALVNVVGDRFYIIFYVLVAYFLAFVVQARFTARERLHIRIVFLLLDLTHVVWISLLQRNYKRCSVLIRSLRKGSLRIYLFSLPVPVPLVNLTFGQAQSARKLLENANVRPISLLLELLL